MNGSLDSCFQQLSNAPNIFLFFEIKKVMAEMVAVGGGRQGESARAFR